MKNIIEAKNIIKTYEKDGLETHVLKGLDIEIKEGEFVAIMGRSGAGKSTLLYQLSLLDRPTSGEIHLIGKRVDDLDEYERTKFRLNNLGYVFQDYALLPDLTAIENCMVPFLARGMSASHAETKSQEVLEKIGLGHRLHNLPRELSGGEQQRVSIARSIAGEPEILFADEPTANLDSYSGNQVIELFEELHKHGQTIVMVTHEEEYGKRANRIIKVSDGKVVNK
ncbi:MAG TPA: ABC transporter ATP-binding protein [Candidatus Paceibacterota bacterium]